MTGNTNFDMLLTTTLKSRTGKLADNMSDGNALLRRLKERGNICPISGGTSIVEELEYGESDSYWYSGYDTLTFNNPQLFTAAEYEMKFLAAPVGASGEELLKNSGKERIVDLLLAKVKNAEKTLKNQMSVAIYSDGTGSSGKQLTGLKALVADVPTSGTVGGINRATSGNEFWRNWAKTASASLTSETIYDAMNEAYLGCSRGTDRPDLIVASDDMYKIYESSLVPQQRFVNAKLADAGFQNLKFKGADVIYDGGTGGACPAKHMYFLNTEYLRLRPHKDRNFKMIGDKDRVAVNQDAIYRIIGWAGNLTMNNAKLQGVLIDYTAPAGSN
ncbi:MAG: phage major capsid protein [Alphaproteobacteria bacterium]|nr:phage major capsid protein [Alphaproteobacteria bacterium]